MQQMMSQGPQMQQSTARCNSMQQQLLGMQLSMNLESRKAKLIAEMTQEFMEEENKIMGEYGRK